MDDKSDDDHYQLCLYASITKLVHFLLLALLISMTSDLASFKKFCPRTSELIRHLIILQHTHIVSGSLIYICTGVEKVH